MNLHLAAKHAQARRVFGCSKIDEIVARLHRDRGRLLRSKVRQGAVERQVSECRGAERAAFNFAVENLGGLNDNILVVIVSAHAAKPGLFLFLLFLPAPFLLTKLLLGVRVGIIERSITVVSSFHHAS